MQKKSSQPQPVPTIAQVPPVLPNMSDRTVAHKMPIPLAMYGYIRFIDLQRRERAWRPERPPLRKSAAQAFCRRKPRCDPLRDRSARFPTWKVGFWEGPCLTQGPSPFQRHSAAQFATGSPQCRAWPEISGTMNEGVIISAELVLVMTIGVIGLTVGLSEVAHAVVQELNDVGDAIGSLTRASPSRDSRDRRIWRLGRAVSAEAGVAGAASGPSLDAWLVVHRLCRHLR